MDKFDEAVRYFNNALRINPNTARVHHHLGVAFARQKKETEAIFHFYEVLRIDPNYADALYNLGIIFSNQGNIKEAIDHYKRALYLNPNMSLALYNLSWILATCEDDEYRNGEEAIKLATELCKITNYKIPQALEALAAAYAETKEFDAAVLSAQKGLQLAEIQGPKEVALRLKKRLGLYKKEKSYHQNLSKKKES
jgi:tetratricopeptide (TPR) repeat protein